MELLEKCTNPILILPVVITLKNKTSGIQCNLRSDNYEDPAGYTTKINYED